MGTSWLLTPELSVVDGLHRDEDMLRRARQPGRDLLPQLAPAGPLHDARLPQRAAAERGERGCGRAARLADPTFPIERRLGKSDQQTYD